MVEKKQIKIRGKQEKYILCHTLMLTIIIMDVHVKDRCVNYSNTILKTSRELWTEGNQKSIKSKGV